MIGLSAAWRTHQQDTRGTARALGSVKFQDSHDLLENHPFRAVTIKLNDLSLAGLLDALNLKPIFSESILRELFNVILLELDDLILALEITLHLVDANILGNVEQDKFVRDDAHLLQSDGLKAGTGEAFNDPARAAVIVFLELLNLHLD